MVISVSGAFQAELDKQANGDQPTYLINVDCTTGQRRFTLWNHDVTYSGDTYDAGAPIGQIDPIQLDQATPTTKMSIGFEVQGDSSLLTDLQQNIRGRLMTFYFTFIVGGVVVNGGEVIRRVSRRMVPGSISTGKEYYDAEVQLESKFFKSKLRAPRTYSHGEQQKVDPTDFCLVDSGVTFDTSHPKFVSKSGF